MSPSLSNLPAGPHERLVQGEFSDGRSLRPFRTLTRCLGLLLALFILGALVVYGIKVHYETSINKTARQARELNEENRELQVSLNRILSYKNVEAAALQTPHLQLPSIVVDVKMQGNERFAPLPVSSEALPQKYGY